MPTWMEYISFFSGIISLILTFFTYLNTRNFKRQLIHNAELSDFRETIEDTIHQITGYISSINDDGLSDETFKSALLQFLTDLETRYSFLSRNTQKVIHTLKKCLDNPELSPADWHIVANQLIKLKNSLNKERAIYG